MIRKFFEPGVEVVAGKLPAGVSFDAFKPAEATAQTETTVTETEQNSEETKVEAKADKPAEASASSETPADKDKSAAPAKTETVQAPAPTPTLAELIKGKSKSEVLKLIGSDEEVLTELGVSKEMQELIRYYNQTGNAYAYLEAKSIDYDNMSAEDLIRREVLEAHPKAPKSVIDKLTQKELSKYDLEDAENAEYNKYLLEEKVATLRAAGKEKQAKLVIPEGKPKEQGEDPAVKSERERAEAERVAHLEKFNAEVAGHELTKAVLTNKKLTVSEGLQIVVKDPQAIVDETTGKASFFQRFHKENADGTTTLDYNNWYRTNAFAQDPDGYEKALIDYGKTLARNERLEEEENPDDKKSKESAAGKKESPLTALNKRARQVS